MGALIETEHPRTSSASHRGGGIVRDPHRRSATPVGDLTNRLEAVLGATQERRGTLPRCLTRLVAELEPNIAPGSFKEALPEDDVFDRQSFINAMAELGYQSHGLKSTPLDIDERLLPCLFVPDAAQSSPAVVLAKETAANRITYSVYRGNADSVEALDSASPLLGERGTCFVFRKVLHGTSSEPASRVRPDRERQWISSILSRFTPHIAKILTVGLLLNIVALSTPLFVMVVYDRVISPQSTEGLPVLLVGAAFALALELALRAQRTAVLSWMTGRIHYIVGTEVFKQLLAVPPALLQRTSPTAQISRLKSLESVRDFFSGPIFASTMELPSVVISISVLMFFSFNLALITLFSIVAYASLFLILRPFISTSIRAAASEASVAQRFLAESMLDREEISANGLADIWKEKFREISSRENTANAHLQFLTAVGEHVAYAISILTGLIALLLGVSLVWSGALSAGMLVASMILVWRAIAPFANVCSQIARFEQFRNSTRQINELMEVETESESRAASARLPALSGAVELQNVSLRYRRDSNVLFHGLNLRVRPGEAIGICGAMGTGKSTLLRLLNGMQTPHAGRILIDTIDVQQLEARELRRMISHIPQAPQCYPGSVAENIRIVAPDATDEQLWRVLDRCGAAKQVHDLPLGLDQPIHTCRNDQALLFRLAFARHCIRPNQIVLIDEIGAASLIGGLQELADDYIESARGRQTVFFVSQRFEQLKLADRIIGLQYGKAPIIGSLDQVLEATQ